MVRFKLPCRVSAVIGNNVKLVIKAVNPLITNKQAGDGDFLNNESNSQYNHQTVKSDAGINAVQFQTGASLRMLEVKGSQRDQFDVCWTVFVPLSSSCKCYLSSLILCLTCQIFRCSRSSNSFGFFSCVSWSFMLMNFFFTS